MTPADDLPPMPECPLQASDMVTLRLKQWATAYALAARAELNAKLKLVQGDLANMHANWNAACQDIERLNAENERIRGEDLVYV